MKPTISFEERKQGDLERNALVSVLLCCLEVYDGIITLTTNRVRAIDAAVQSRVNLAIQYHDLTPEQRLNIYRNRLKWVPDDEIGDRAALDRALLSSPVTKFGNKSNGRQIRNTVNGARALARSQGVGLMADHIETVEENTSNCTQSMSLLLQIQRARNEVD